ncbi:KAT8 regulatory NSL complex subunit 2-like isoform X2 [Babylonia areolata]|uniref:KAT8 regulatory NSL complex subunit 2-like isoform X2 n=1 Tax=Babylonia areolata TaxID=304850 RepID=UPI003FD19E15
MNSRNMLRGKAALIRNIKSRGTSERLPCAYSHRQCTQTRLENYDYCLKHILEDKNSPFKQCSFTAPKTNRRCTNAAPKSDRKEGFCLEHAKRIVLSRQRAGRKQRAKETAETLLEELAMSSAAALDASNDTKRLRRPVDSIASKALEYGSSSDSDTEVPSVDQAWRRDNDSDAESIDSEQEDPLKHAGVYSQEEAALLLRDKLIRLQSLYIDQFKRLQHVLKEKRRKFLHTYKQEREMLGPIQAYKQDPAQRKKYERLRAMRRYHKFFGKEALLHQKCNLRRIAVAEGVNHRPPVFSRCTVNTPDGRCNKKVVPLSKFCMGHILLDPHQVLFEACRFRNGQCGEPVFSVDDVPLCRHHFAAAAAPAPVSCAMQTEDPLKVEVDIKIEVDDIPVQPEPTTAPRNTATPHTSRDNTVTGLQVGSSDDRCVPEADSISVLDVVDDDRLNSSGEGALDIGDLNVSMDDDDLIRFVEGEHIDAINNVLDNNLLD